MLTISSIFLLIVVSICSGETTNRICPPDTVDFATKVEKSSVVVYGKPMAKIMNNESDSIFRISFQVDCVLKGPATLRQIDINNAGRVEGKTYCQDLPVGRGYAIVFLEPTPLNATDRKTYVPADFVEIVDQKNSTIQLLARTCNLHRIVPLQTLASVADVCPQSPVTIPVRHTVVNKIFSEDYIAAYECVKHMNGDETRNYEREIIKQVTKYLVSHPSLPMPSFNFDLINEFFQSTEPENNDESFLSKIFDVALKDPNMKKYLESIIEKIQKTIEMGSSHRLHYVGFALIALEYILNQDAIYKLKRYVQKAIEYSKQGTMLGYLKFALDDLKTKISAIQDILSMNNLTQLSKNEKKELVLSLFFPCDEIYKKITMEEGIYQTFAFYTFEVVVLSFIVDLGVLRIAIDEFQINVHDKLKERCSQYPLILDKYLKLMTNQRPKLKIKKTAKGDALEDTLVNEYIYVSNYPYGLLAAFMRSNDNFYDAYKEKFQGNIDFFEKAVSELIENTR